METSKSFGEKQIKKKSQDGFCRLNQEINSFVVKDEKGSNLYFCTIKSPMKTNVCFFCD